MVVPTTSQLGTPALRVVRRSPERGGPPSSKERQRELSTRAAHLAVAQEFDDSSCSDQWIYIGSASPTITCLDPVEVPAHSHRNPDGLCPGLFDSSSTLPPSLSASAPNQAFHVIFVAMFEQQPNPRTPPRICRRCGAMSRLNGY